jgi:hypothetical protein
MSDAAQPIAWIIEPVKSDAKPYLTLNAEVAEKREKKGDIVTPYNSKKSIQNEEEEL